MQRYVLFRLAALGLAASSLIAQPPKTTTPVVKTPASTPAAAAATDKPATPPAPVRENGLYATIYTSMGNITGKLYEKESPITVKNFMDLALGRKEWTDPKTRERTKRPLYPGTIFHRVIPGFMIQGGDPTGTGMGGTDTIPEEFDPSLSFDTPGKFGMAKTSAPGTGSCQFFITEVPTPHLNGLHTVFGQVVEGQDVVEKIARLPGDANNKPTVPPKILRITFLRVGPGAPVNPPTTVTRKAGPPAATKKAGTTASAAAKKTGAPAAAAKKSAPPAAPKQ
jgi:cyclophilin family peptidyl-prolyl cis-trans isomerase